MSQCSLSIIGRFSGVFVGFWVFFISFSVEKFRERQTKIDKSSYKDEIMNKNNNNLFQLLIIILQPNLESKQCPQHHPVFNEYLVFVFLYLILNPDLVHKLLLCFTPNKRDRRLTCKVRMFLSTFAAGSIMNWSMFESWLEVWILFSWLFMVKEDT